MRIYLFVIGNMVAVIGSRLVKWREPEYGYAQIEKVIQLIGYAVQVPAKKLLYIRFIFKTIEPIDKYLIDYRIRYPIH